MPLEFQTALPPHVFGIPVQETPPLPRNSKMPPVVWYGYFLESPIAFTSSRCFSRLAVIACKLSGMLHESD